jgi:uroporphyrin-III C-methyltransferase
VRIRTGKRAGKASMSQETISRLMLTLARRGLKVVRLKGGDPSVFGRSGEERTFLEAHGVSVEIIPGVTAASAAAAQFAFPLTHRAQARRIVFATARIADGALQTEGWRDLASAETTVALYIARDAAAAVASRLMAEGRSGLTPCLVIENAGRPQARAEASILDGLGAACAAMAPTGPVLLVIGAVTLQARLAGGDRSAGPDVAPSAKTSDAGNAVG